MTKKALFFVGILSLAITGFVLAEMSPVNKNSKNVAIKGYDPVAYFKQEKAVPGKKEFEHEWNGAKWRFSSAENRDLFAKDPTKYAPQYGGFCAYGVSEGHLAEVDPRVWKVVDGKLYLNYNAEVGHLWRQDIPGRIAKANQAWPQLIKK